MIAVPTVAAALSWADQRLSAAGVEDGRLEARILLEHCLGLTRAQLLCQPGHPLTPRELGAYRALVARRADREPLAYVVGHWEFLGLDFAVDSRVLVPRPETELLVEEALKVLQEVFGRGIDAASVRDTRRDPGALRFDGGHGLQARVADVATGSGVIAVSLAVRRPDVLVYALDISSDALAVAAENAHRHGVSRRVVLLQGDLLQPLPEPVDVIVANLPYVSSADLVDPQPEVAREPRLALDGGPDGLELLRRLIGQVSRLLLPGGALLLEIGASQGPAVVALARQAFPGASIRLVADYAGLDRVVVVRP